MSCLLLPSSLALGRSAKNSSQEPPHTTRTTSRRTVSVTPSPPTNAGYTTALTQASSFRDIAFVSPGGLPLLGLMAEPPCSLIKFPAHGSRPTSTSPESSVAPHKMVGLRTNKILNPLQLLTKKGSNKGSDQPLPPKEMEPFLPLGYLTSGTVTPLGRVILFNGVLTGLAQHYESGTPLYEAGDLTTLIGNMSSLSTPVVVFSPPVHREDLKPSPGVFHKSLVQTLVNLLPFLLNTMDDKPADAFPADHCFTLPCAN